MEQWSTVYCITVISTLALTHNGNINIPANGVKCIQKLRSIKNMSKSHYMKKGKSRSCWACLHHANTKLFPAKIMLDTVSATCATVLKYRITKNAYTVLQTVLQ
jgi:hypothetical protein